MGPGVKACAAPFGEQRLGRIHGCIGQERDVHAFNFVASESEPGQDILERCILERRPQKMEHWRNARAERVLKSCP